MEAGTETQQLPPALCWLRPVPLGSLLIAAIAVVLHFTLLPAPALLHPHVPLPTASGCSVLLSFASLSQPCQLMARWVTYMSFTCHSVWPAPSSSPAGWAEGQPQRTGTDFHARL